MDKKAKPQPAAIPSQYSYSPTDQTSRKPVILAHYRIKPPMSIFNNNIVLNPSSVPVSPNTIIVRDSSTISSVHLPSTSRVQQPKMTLNPQIHQLVLQDKQATATVNYQAAGPSRKVYHIENAYVPFTSEPNGKNSKTTVQGPKKTLKVKLPKGSNIEIVKKIPKKPGCKKPPNVGGAKARKDFSLVRERSGDRVSDSTRQKPFTIVRKNLQNLEENSKKKVTSVANYLEQDTLEKGLEVLDSLDNSALTVLVTKVMDVTNKMYGEYLAEELITHLGAEKYQQIAKQGLTTFGEFLAQRHAAKHNQTSSFIAEAVRSASARASAQLDANETFLKLDPKTLMLDPQPEVLPPRNSMVTIHNGLVNLNEPQEKSEFAEADKYIEEKIDLLRKHDLYEENYILSQSQRHTRPPEKIFESPEAKLPCPGQTDVHDSEETNSKSPKSSKKYSKRMKRIHSIKDPLLSEPSESVLEVKSVVLSSPDISTNETSIENHIGSGGTDKFDGLISPIMRTPEKDGAALGLTRTPTPISKAKPSESDDFLGFPSKASEEQQRQKILLLLARMTESLGDVKSPKANDIDNEIHETSEEYMSASENADAIVSCEVTVNTIEETVGESAIEPDITEIMPEENHNTALPRDDVEGPALKLEVFDTPQQEIAELTKELQSEDNVGDEHVIKVTDIDQSLIENEAEHVTVVEGAENVVEEQPLMAQPVERELEGNIEDKLLVSTEMSDIREIDDEVVNEILNVIELEEPAELKDDVSPKAHEITDENKMDERQVIVANLENEPEIRDKSESNDEEQKVTNESTPEPELVPEAVQETTNNESGGRYSPDLEQSMNDLAQLLVSFQASSLNKIQPLACESGISNDSFETFAQKAAVTLETDKEETSDVEESADDLAALLLQFHESSKSNLGVRKLETGKQYEEITPYVEHKNTSESSGDNIGSFSPRRTRSSKANEVASKVSSQLQDTKPVRSAQANTKINGFDCKIKFGDEKIVPEGNNHDNKAEATQRRTRKLRMQYHRYLLRRRVAALSRAIRNRLKKVKTTCTNFQALVNLTNIVINDPRIANAVLRQKVKNLDFVYKLVKKVFKPFKEGDALTVKKTLGKLRGAQSCSHIFKGKNKKIMQKRADSNERPADALGFMDDLEEPVTMKPMKTYSRGQKTVFPAKSDSAIVVDNKIPISTYFPNKSEGFGEFRNSSLYADYKEGSGIVQCFIYKGKGAKKITLGGKSHAGKADFENTKPGTGSEMIVIKQLPVFDDEEPAGEPSNRGLKRKRNHKGTYEFKPGTSEFGVLKEEYEDFDVTRSQKRKKKDRKSSGKRYEAPLSKRLRSLEAKSSETRTREKALSSPLPVKETKSKKIKGKAQSVPSPRLPQRRLRGNACAYYLRKRPAGNNP